MTAQRADAPSADSLLRATRLLGADVDAEWAPDELAAWVGVVDASRTVRGALDEVLEREHALTMSTTGILGRLVAADRGTLRLTALAVDTGLSLSRVSRLIDGLQRRGLVERVPCPSDARAINAHITPAGAALVPAAQSSLRAVVRQRFLAQLDDGDAAVLATVLTRVLDGADRVV